TAGRQRGPQIDDSDRARSSIVRERLGGVYECMSVCVYECMRWAGISHSHTLTLSHSHTLTLAYTHTRIHSLPLRSDKDHAIPAAHSINRRRSILDHVDPLHVVRIDHRQIQSRSHLRE